MDDDSGKRRVLQELHNEQLLKDGWQRRAEAAEADAAACRAERAHYGDIMTSKLAAAEAECEALRAELAEANAETEAAQNETIHLRDAMNGASLIGAKLIATRPTPVSPVTLSAAR